MKNTNAAVHDREHYNQNIENPTLNHWLVLEGDWGGQNYLTVPWSQVGPKARIQQPLLARFIHFGV